MSHGLDTSGLWTLRVEKSGLRMKKGGGGSDKIQRPDFLCQSGGKKKKILMDCFDK